MEVEPGHLARHGFNREGVRGAVHTGHVYAAVGIRGQRGIYQQRALNVGGFIHEENSGSPAASDVIARLAHHAATRLREQQAHVGAVILEGPAGAEFRGQVLHEYAALSE